MEITKEQVLNALSYVMEPDLKKDVVSAGLVHDLIVDGNHVSFRLQVSNPAMHNRKRLEDACLHYLKQYTRDDVEASVKVEALPADQNERGAEEERSHFSEVKHVIAVASGKGGVGKSTLAANLAAGLNKLGFRVGLIDADIYGPSVPLMFDVVYEKPGVTEIEGNQFMTPVRTPWGVDVMSIGFFADPEQAVVWRGPMASKALEQMFADVYWGDLDFMIIDLPPGTGDIHLTLVKQAPLTGAVVVSTPQAIALSDAKKGVAMFQLDTINVPVLGIVENMSYFVPEDMPDKKYHIFGENGAKELAERLEVPLLGQIPLVQSIREAGDAGRPAVLQGYTMQAKELLRFAASVAEQVGEHVAVLEE